MATSHFLNQCWLILAHVECWAISWPTLVQFILNCYVLATNTVRVFPMYNIDYQIFHTVLVLFSLVSYTSENGIYLRNVVPPICLFSGEFVDPLRPTERSIFVLYVCVCIGSRNGLLPFGAKPFLDTMLIVKQQLTCF